MENKNHDYGEAWRDMRVSSLTDLILQKLHHTLNQCHYSPTPNFMIFQCFTLKNVDRKKI